MPGWAFALMVAGGLWLSLWQGRVRLLGLAPVLIGAIGAASAPTPDLLVTGDGRHVAVVREGVPHMLRERTGDYMRSLLGEAAGFDGEPYVLGGAGFSACSRDSCVANFGGTDGRRWRLLATKSSQRIDWDRLVAACADADVAVSERWLPRGCTPRWLKLDRKTLEQTGGVALFVDGTPRFETVAERVGQHPWASVVPEYKPREPRPRLRPGSTSAPNSRSTPPAHFPKGR